MSKTFCGLPVLPPGSSSTWLTLSIALDQVNEFSTLRLVDLRNSTFACSAW
jgi:hypothetical protein